MNERLVMIAVLVGLTAVLVAWCLRRAQLRRATADRSLKADLGLGPSAAHRAGRVQMDFVAVAARLQRAIEAYDWGHDRRGAASALHDGKREGGAVHAERARSSPVPSPMTWRNQQEQQSGGDHHGSCH